MTATASSPIGSNVGKKKTQTRTFTRTARGEGGGIVEHDREKRAIQSPRSAIFTHGYLQKIHQRRISAGFGATGGGDFDEDLAHRARPQKLPCWHRT